MKKETKIVCVVFSLFLLMVVSGCGVIEKGYDDMNYESLSGEMGDIFVMSGGKIMFEYKNATIIYSDSGSQTMFVKTEKGEKIYIQGDLIVELR